MITRRQTIDGSTTPLRIPMTRKRTIAGRPRKGCLECGKFVMSLDDALSTMRHASNKYAKYPTVANRNAAQRAKTALDATKRYHNEHMLTHKDDESDRET